MEEQKPGIFRNIISLVKVIIWPSLVLLVLFTYKAEIDDGIDLLLLKFRGSSKISLGSFSLEILEQAKGTDNEELGEILAGLSKESIRKLLREWRGDHDIMLRARTKYEGPLDVYLFPNSYEFDAYKELEEAGLLKGTESLAGFENWFSKLKIRKKTRYKRADDASRYTEVITRTHNIPFTQMWVLKKDLSKEDIKRIDKFRIKLSEQGKKAFDIVVDLIIKYIPERKVSP